MLAKCIKTDGCIEVGKIYICEEFGDNFIIRGISSTLSREQFNELFEPCNRELEFTIFRIASRYPYCLNEGEWGYQKFLEGFLEGIKYANGTKTGNDS